MYRQNYTKCVMLSMGVIIVISVCMSAPAMAFITVDYNLTDDDIILDYNILMHRVHDRHWEINYGFSEDCDHEYHSDPRELANFETAMEIALRVWLQPLREIETQQPIVDSFSFKRTELETWEEPTTGRVELVDIKFHCSNPPFRSYARIKNGRRAAVVVAGFISNDISPEMRTLVHELGHAFGLGDTYVRDTLFRKSSGGLKDTIGIQPASVMGMLYKRPYFTGVPPGFPSYFQGEKLAKIQYLTEDDKNGIVWLYKVFYGDLPITDCYFSDYVFEKDTGGFRPKYPLLFEIKQGFQGYAIEIIENDPNMDINVRDGSGHTALDYAIINKYLVVLYKLLLRPDLKVNATNSEGHTSLHLSISNNYQAGVDALLSHNNINVNAKDKQGRTPLHIAAKTGALASVKALLQHTQIQINAQDNIGFTALDYAGKYYVDHDNSRVFDALIKGKYNAKADTVEVSPPEGMVLIPAGEFQMGSNDEVVKDDQHPMPTDDEHPVRTVYVDAFYMDEAEVTNAQYQEFLIANPHWRDGYIEARHSGGYHFQQTSLSGGYSFQQVRMRDPWHLEDWIGNDYPEGKGNHPVTYVNWYEAMAYAKWAGKRLPTEAEWERAARGGLVGKKYPHGDTITPQDANYGQNVGDTTAVRSYPANAYGLYDMAGNVWEWCLDASYGDFYVARWIKKFMNIFINIKGSRVLRGGSWNNAERNVRVATRVSGSPMIRVNLAGFRCVRDVSP